MDLSVEDMLWIIVAVQVSGLVSLVAGLSQMQKDIKAIRGSLTTLAMKAITDE